MKLPSLLLGLFLLPSPAHAGKCEDDFYTRLAVSDSPIGLDPRYPGARILANPRDYPAIREWQAQNARRAAARAEIAASWANRVPTMSPSDKELLTLPKYLFDWYPDVNKARIGGQYHVFRIPDFSKAPGYRDLTIEDVHSLPGKNLVARVKEVLPAGLFRPEKAVLVLPDGTERTFVAEDILMYENPVGPTIPVNLKEVLKSGSDLKRRTPISPAKGAAVTGGLAAAGGAVVYGNQASDLETSRPAASLENEPPPTETDFRRRLGPQAQAELQRIDTAVSLCEQDRNDSSVRNYGKSKTYRYISGVGKENGMNDVFRLMSFERSAMDKCYSLDSSAGLDKLDAESLKLFFLCQDKRKLWNCVWEIRNRGEDK